MRQISEMISILLMGIASMSVGEDIITTKGNRITLPVNSVDSKFLSVQEDGSVASVTCDTSLPRGRECRILLVKDSALQMVYPPAYSGHNNSTRPIQLALTGNSVFCLMTQFEQRGSNQGEYVFGVVVDLLSNKTLELDLPSDLEVDDQFIGVFYETDKAEVLVRNHSVCAELARCKLTFDTTGQQLGKPAPFPVNYLTVGGFPKLAGSMDKGVLATGETEPYTRRRWQSLQITYIDADGNSTIVNRTKVLDYRPFFSSTRDVYGYCLQSVWYDRFECQQFDWRTRSTVAVVNFTLYDMAVKSMVPAFLSFANLNESKFLFVILDCEPYAGHECKTARAVTVDSHGRSLKSTTIFNDLECVDTETYMSRTAEVGNQLCMYIMCHPVNTFEYSNLYSKCHPKSSF